MREDEILEKYDHGDAFSALIKGHDVSGNISFGEDDDDVTRVYFCTNDANCSGEDAPDKLGYLHSWIWDHRITEIVITPKLKESVIVNNYPIY